MVTQLKGQAMPRAACIIAGDSRNVDDAMVALARLGDVDMSSVRTVELWGFDMDGEHYATPATKVTADVTPRNVP